MTWRELQVLASVERLSGSGSSYGAAIANDIAWRSGQELSPGHVYTLLARLASYGYIDCIPAKTGWTRTYKVIPTGREALNEARASLE